MFKSIKKAIILNGLARSGTNIVWNILQSNPNIFSTIKEINEIYDNSNRLILNKYSINLLYLISVYLPSKSKNTQKKRDKAICYKGICSDNSWDLKFNNFLNSQPEETYYINLIRNGYTICSSWTRRGISAKKTGYLYSKYCEEIIKYNETNKSKILKFEHVLDNIFGVASELFTYVNQPIDDFEYIRLKTKAIIDENGILHSPYGKIGKKYWFNRMNISCIINDNINFNQIKNLSLKDIKVFENETKEYLNHFNYNIQI